MVLSNNIGPTFSNNVDTKRHQLIDKIILHRRDVQKQLVKRIQELRKDPSKKLVVSRPFIEEFKTFKIECDTSYDTKIWNLCLAYAHLKLNISINSLSHYNATFEYGTEAFALILEILKPLIQRTLFKEMNGEFCEYPNSDIQNLENILDSVQKKIEDDTEQLVADWEEIKFSRETRMAAHDFRISRIGGKKEIGFALMCTSAKDYTLWNSAFASALSVLNIPETSVHGFHFGNPNTYFGTHFHGKMSFVDLENVLILLKPLAPIMHFEILHCDGTAEIAEFLTNFFEMGAIGCMLTPHSIPEDRKESFSFSPLLELVRKVRPMTVTYDLLGTDTEADDLLALAELVEDISISEFGCTFKQNPFNLIKSILSRKCVSLAVYGRTTVLSLADGEELIQFAHHQSKKVSFQIRTITDAVETQVGEYIIQVRPWQTTLEHMNIEKRFSNLQRYF